MPSMDSDLLWTLVDFDCRNAVATTPIVGRDVPLAACPPTTRLKLDTGIVVSSI